MKKSDKNQAGEPSSTATPPIDNTTSNESKPQEENQTTTPKVETVDTPPIGEVKPVEPAATNTPPVETISAPPISGEPPPVHNAEPIKPAPAMPETPPPQTKPFSGLSEWMNADWNKSNADLAKENGVSRQAVAQMRKKVEAEKAKGNTPTFADVTKPQAEQVEMVSKVVDYDVMAATVFDMSVGLLTTTFGPEWQPRPAQQPGQPGERDAVCYALKHYFASKQAQDIPPGLMLTAVVIAYAGPRLRAPNTANKLQMAWTWFKLKLSKFRKKKE